MKISPTQFFTFHISSCFLGYIYIVLYIYVRQTIVLHSLYFFTIYSAWHSGILLASADGSSIYMLACKMVSLLHLSSLAPQEGREGPMWWWRGTHTPQSHALCCRSCGLHHLYHQTSRLGANHSSSANCRGIKGKENKTLALLWCLSFLWWQTDGHSLEASQSRALKSLNHGPKWLGRHPGAF